MPIESEKLEITFPSTDGRSTIHACIWHEAGVDVSECKPHAVVQLVHGMSEYIERYDDFARFLVGEGYMVVGHDHVGHGQSVADKSEWGCLPLNGGADVLVEDVHALRKLVRQMMGDPNPRVPHVLFGHSMGSFVVRSYISRHGKNLAGAVICGTGFVQPSVAGMGLKLAKLFGKTRGENAKSKLLNSMADGAYAKAIPHARTPFDWLNNDPDSVDAYIADDACGFLFSIGGYATLFSLLVQVNDIACAQDYRKDLPLLYIAGDQDPVGDCGEGVRKAARLALDAGVADVNIKLYEGLRHEILNEPAHVEVYEDVLGWIGRVTE